MPFILKKDRPRVEKDGPITPGEKCYVFYKVLVHAWRKHPSWSVVDHLYEWIKESRSTKEWERSAELAWQVFFIKYVWPYEQKKCKENGDV